jgi:excisionase family DNA binding protein
MERNLRTGQVAKELGVAAATVQHYARTGRVPSRLTPGKQYRFNLEEVRAALGVTELAGVTVRDPSGSTGLVSIFDGATTVAVDELTGFRPDPVTAEAEARLRVRAAREPGRRAGRGAVWTTAPTSGSSQLGELIERSGGAAVAVLHR